MAPVTLVQDSQATAIIQRSCIDAFMNTISPKLLTLPDSPQNLPESSEDALVSVSTTFLPGAQNHPSQTDLVLLSSDSVFFYVHSIVLLSASTNCFNSLLPVKSMTQDAEAIVPVSDPSEVLNVILHTIYKLSCSHYGPAFDTISAGVSGLETYGVHLHEYIRPTTPLFSLLISHAGPAPLDVYALAAQHDLHELAVSTSSHLLSFSLANLSDDVAQTIGPIYLKRLFFLHLGRADILKNLLLSPLHPHEPTSDCDSFEQKKLTCAWALASASLALDARPGECCGTCSPRTLTLMRACADMPSSTLEATLKPLGQYLYCEHCSAALMARIHQLITQWSIVKRTI